MTELELRGWQSPPLSLNKRLHYHAEAKIARELREYAGWAARAAKVGGPYEHVTVTLHWRPGRKLIHRPVHGQPARLWLTVEPTSGPELAQTALDHPGTRAKRAERGREAPGGQSAASEHDPSTPTERTDQP